jgi:6-phosphogluconolactonase
VLNVLVLPDAAAVAVRAAAIVAGHARAAVGERGQFGFAVSGGRTPALMLARLAHEDMPWSSSVLFQVDERIAPFGDPDRNLTQLRAHLPAEARVNPMPVEDADLEAAAARYGAALPERFDVVHLGLGADGHTASLVPDDPVLDVTDRSVALTAPYMGRRRMTLTYPVNRARHVLWVATGEDKAHALARLVAGDGSIPAGRVAPTRALVLADAAAAGTLSR